MSKYNNILNVFYEQYNTERTKRKKYIYIKNNILVLNIGRIKFLIFKHVNEIKT